MKQLLFILGLFLMGSCAPKFNIEKYEKYWVVDSSNSSSDKHYTKGDDEVRIIIEKNRISVLKKNEKSPYKYIEVYNNSSKKYLGGGSYFYDCSFGYWTMYDEKSKVNFNDHFPFSVKKLVKKFRKEYGKDLMNPQNVSRLVRGWSKTKGASYEIILRNLKSEDDYYKFVIDGATGKEIERYRYKDLDHTPKATQ